MGCAFERLSQDRGEGASVDLMKERSESETERSILAGCGNAGDVAASLCSVAELLASRRRADELMATWQAHGVCETGKAVDSKSGWLLRGFGNGWLPVRYRELFEEGERGEGFW